MARAGAVRHRPTVRASLPALALALAATPALADSDGHYCAGKDYLAYEVSLSNPGGVHELRIISFSPSRGIGEPVALPLAAFQVHGMRCGSSTVELLGWDTRYAVEVSNRSRPRLTVSEKLPAPGTVLPGFEAANLGHLGKEGIVDLLAPTPLDLFQLVTAKAERKVDGGIERFTLTELVHRNPPGTIKRSLRLFAGVFLETVN
jgi:hypothetical protein